MDLINNALGYVFRKVLLLASFRMFDQVAFDGERFPAFGAIECLAGIVCLHVSSQV